MTPLSVRDLPMGSAPAPVPAPHFPDALHAVVWRNWDVVDVTHLAQVLQGTPEQITRIAQSMGLPPQRRIDATEQRRNYMTLLRRNWHLLPYGQICQLLKWDAPTLQFYLNEDDFMWVKLGGYKPACPPVHYHEPDAGTRARVREIAELVRRHMGPAMTAPAEPLYGFIERFNQAPRTQTTAGDPPAGFRMVYPYFLRYGDPLTGEGVNDLPDGYLAELANCGVTTLWLQAVLNTLYPWELAPHLSKGWEERIANLNRLIDQCARFGIDVVLYLNEPRAMPPVFFDEHPELRGVNETPARAPYSPDVVALCTSTKPVQDFLVNSVRHVFEKAPKLGGVVVITYSENLTNCYSREYDGRKYDSLALNTEQNHLAEAKACPRCQARGPETVNAEVCTLIERGMRQAGSKGKFILYVWSTPEPWVPGILRQLPDSTYVQNVSEWGKTFTRGDYTGTVNEYSISVIGPSEQSLRQWKQAKDRGLKTSAKMQAGNTYEFSSIPYIPALRRVAQHLENLSQVGVQGLMLGWTAGGSPSPNLDLTAEFAKSPRPDIDQALLNVARRRFGKEAAPEVVKAWNLMSEAYGEFPFDLAVCYFGPQSHGPANLLYSRPTGFTATMCTYAFDDLDHWRGPYSRATFQNQFEKTADLWQRGVEVLERLQKANPSPAIRDEWRIAEACLIHFRSTANQIRYIRLRDDSDPAATVPILKDEIALARRLFDLVSEDSRIGFEATNQYGYTRHDLVEKIFNCEYLLNELGAG